MSSHRTAPRVGLVLGAGGARAFAHIGALKVIDRQNLPIDLVVGVSMGSVVGAAYAAGLSTTAMMDIAKAVRLRALFRPRLGRCSVVDPSGVRQLVRDFLGDRRFEDLDRELAVLAASVTTGEPIVIREGRVADGVLASTAIPLFFPYVARDGDYLIDGGMVDGLPVRLARQLGADVVVAVDGDNHARRLLRAPGLRQLTRRLTSILVSQGGSPVPNGALVLARMLQHMIEPSQSETPDVLIRPRFGRTTSFHYHRWQRCIRLGESAAESALTEMLALCPRERSARKRVAWRSL